MIENNILKKNEKMKELINIDEKKYRRYERLYKQIDSHMKKTDDKISKMVTINAILHNKISYFFWTGFYFLKNIAIYKNKIKNFKNHIVESNDALNLKDDRNLKKILNLNNIIINKKPQLVIGPYQGSLACLTLKFPEGVCWYSVLNNCSIIVDDVHKFPGHIPCDARSKSEIVIPVYDKSGKMYAVFDIDSDKYISFDDVDRTWLEKIVSDFLS